MNEVNQGREEGRGKIGEWQGNGRGGEKIEDNSSEGENTEQDEAC